MPYNTRRKSLSLPQLGIALPGSGARSGAHRPPPAAIKEESNDDTTSLPPAKRTKRAHTTPSSSTSPPPISPQHTRRPSNIKQDSAKRPQVAQHTPPPSPGGRGSSNGFKVDTRGIDDDIVVGVIEQIEKTGNRPHLLKELAAVLANTLVAVERSANPSAIISSRLSSYLNRNWTPLSPCPVGKQLIGTHPKRLFFYLTNQPHQPFPEPADIALMNNAAAAARIISPSLSSAADDEDIDTRKREELSPSPEVDLGNPDFDADASRDDSFGSSSSTSRKMSSGHHSSLANRHNETPPLERDEREFTQTVTSLQARSRSQSIYTTADVTMSENQPSIPKITEDNLMTEPEETEEFAAQKNIETAAALFGQANGTRHLAALSTVDFASSPMMKPALGIDTAMANATTSKPEHVDVPMFSGGLDGWSGAWNEIKSPETVGLDELDDLFASY